ncbi:MAG: hypothetical protein ACQESE_04615 [Nanobdellota archaeon]
MTSRQDQQDRDNHDQNEASSPQNYVALGSRQVMTLLKAAGFTNTHAVDTKETFHQELAKYSQDTIIITTASWKSQVTMLESYPYTVTLPDTMARINDTKDINTIKAQVLGVETGGS